MDSRYWLKTVVESDVDRAFGDINNHGAGIPLNPIVGE